MGFLNTIGKEGKDKKSVKQGRADKATFIP